MKKQANEMKRENESVKKFLSKHKNAFAMTQTPTELDNEILNLKKQINDISEEIEVYRQINKSIDVEKVKYLSQLQERMNQVKEIETSTEELSKRTSLIKSENLTLENKIAATKQRISKLKYVTQYSESEGQVAAKSLKEEKETKEKLIKMRQNALKERNDLIKKRDSLSVEYRKALKKYENEMARKEVELMKKEGY